MQIVKGKARLCRLLCGMATVVLLWLVVPVLLVTAEGPAPGTEPVPALWDEPDAGAAQLPGRLDHRDVVRRVPWDRENLAGSDDPAQLSL